MATYTISLMKSIDIRSDPAVRLLGEFLDIGHEEEPTTAEHFVHGEERLSECRKRLAEDASVASGLSLMTFYPHHHLSSLSELYSFLRSPFRDLDLYDAAVQVSMQMRHFILLHSPFNLSF